MMLMSSLPSTQKIEKDDETTLTTIDFNDSSSSTIKTTATTYKSEYDLGLWIGLKTKAEISSSNSQYSNFYEDQSVNGCALIDTKGKWKIQSCQSLRGFVCQQVTVRR